MTTYEWEPGNIYGGHANPTYNALSYIWGRYELRDYHDSPEITAITIHGASWTIPRIRPTHFTKESFEAVIADTANPHPSENAPNVDFLWLDVACIDQTPGSRDKAREIGRQAKIFKGAAQVSVWLTTHDRSFYRDWASRMEPQFEIMCGPSFHTEANISVWVNTIKGLVDEMIADPWFSSLWTLQETFLSPNASIIPSDAMKREVDLFQTSHFSDMLETFKDALGYNDFIQKIDEQCDLSAVIDKTGLLVCLNKNAMGLLTASGNRTTVHDEDRVYGIMQVFDLQLGNSAPDSDPNQHFSLEELNDQLGAALLTKEPVLSQMHFYGGVVAPGKGWRFDRTSTMPSKTQTFYHRRKVKPKISSRATLSTGMLDASLWGYFSGLTLIIPSLRQISRARLAECMVVWECYRLPR
ncbi:MAG: hypothetical protein Q9213_000167 [Squamulea squamosa]